MILSVDVIVMKGLIFNIFYFVWMWWSWKNWFLNIFYFVWMWWFWKKWFLTFSTLGECGCLERTNYLHVLICVDMMVLKTLIVNIFYFVWMWWSWKNLFLIIFYFVWMWWSWKNWFLIIFYFVWNVVCVERIDFQHCLLCVDVVVLKELILNSFHFVLMWWSWNTLIFNIFYFVWMWWFWKK